MSANPCGRWFISYRRGRPEQIRGLVETLREHGIPTWLDISDLKSAPTEEELRRTIRADETAGALMLATPDVVDSPTIRRIEAPEILKRSENDSAFAVIVALADGLDYGDMKEVYGPELRYYDLNTWNVTKLAGNPMDEADIKKVVREVVERRVQDVNSYLSADEPLSIVLNTRQTQRPSDDVALSIDWTHRFEGRYCAPELWNCSLIPALGTIAEILHANSPRRRINMSGLLSLCAALAAGTRLARTGGLRASWLQRSDFREAQWSLDNEREAVPLRTRVSGADTTEEDVAILVGLTNGVQSEFGRSREGLSAFRVVCSVELEKYARDLTGGQVASIVDHVVDVIRGARAEYNAKGILHIFMAAPAGFAFMLGQCLNTFHTVQTYEYDASAPTPYIPAARISIV